MAGSFCLDKRGEQTMHLFKNRNFCLLFSTTALSNLASKIFNFVMSWYILERTGSALQMGT